MSDTTVIGPQPGPQTQALMSPADVVVMGGANGGGKSHWLLLEALRHVNVPGYRAVIFRRQSTDITDPGGLWDATFDLYSKAAGWARTNSLDWVFDESPCSNARISFRGLPYYKDATEWDGKELALIGFDEGQTFLELQFWYLFGRMRSTCGVKSCIRMTCNPVHEDDPTGGWLKKLIGWWLDWETGYPIPERSGKLRWFCRLQNELFWADSKQALIDKYGNPDLPDDDPDQPVMPMSITFVPSKLKDNPILMGKTPQYRASLLALPEHLKKQKLDGNWNAKLEAGTFFKIGIMSREGMIVDVAPNGLKLCRAWDLAHTENAGDWTVGVLMGVDKLGNYYILGVIRGQWETFSRDERIKAAAIDDDSGEESVRIRIPEDPSAGKSEAARLIRFLRGHRVIAIRPEGKKDKRAGGFQSQFNAGNVKMVRGPWNSGLLQRLDSFPTKDIPDDEIDALSDAFAELSQPRVTAHISDTEREDPNADKSKFNSLTEDDGIREEWQRIIQEPICPQWKASFAEFREAMGPKGKPEDRVMLRDENERYEPSNCFWGIEGDEPPPKKRKIAIVAN